MKTLIATDVSVFIHGDRYYFFTQVSTIIKRYYRTFGSVSVCCRVTPLHEVTDSHEDVTDMIEQVIGIPSLEKTMLGAYNRQIRAAVEQNDFVICRCPGIIAFRAADAARKTGKPYLAESMGCAWDAYWNHGVVGKFAAPYMYTKMKHTVRHADYALYVTSQFLQNRYPCNKPSIAASNVKLNGISPDLSELRLQKIREMVSGEVTLATTAAVDVRYKGQEYVIKAIPLLNQRGIRVHYILIGGGDQTYLSNIAHRLGVKDQVTFVGRKSLDEVFHLLDTVDIYIQPSLQEGLPRSVIEAMSRGCPCIGAKTAGIPELIDPECVVKRASSKQIADVVCNMLATGLESYARKNHQNSKDYLEEILNRRRNDYFEAIVEQIQHQKK